MRVVRLLTLWCKWSHFLSRKESKRYFEEHREPKELEGNPGQGGVPAVLREAVLQDGGQGDETHSAVSRIPVDENLERREKMFKISNSAFFKSQQQAK